MADRKKRPPAKTAQCPECGVMVSPQGLALHRARCKGPDRPTKQAPDPEPEPEKDDWILG